MAMNDRGEVRRPSRLINAVLETLMCSLFPSLLMDEQPARPAAHTSDGV